MIASYTLVIMLTGFSSGKFYTSTIQHTGLSDQQCKRRIELLERSNPKRDVADLVVGGRAIFRAFCVGQKNFGG